MRRVRLALVLCACLAAPTAAWAAAKAPAKPVGGAKYEGLTAREGPTISGGKTVRKKSRVVLKVARNAKSVTVYVEVLPTACAKSGQGAIAKSRAARISSRGAFKGTITYTGVFDPSVTAKAFFRGHFNGRRATGTVRAEFLKVHGCNSSSAFTATAPAPPKHKHK